MKHDYTDEEIRTAWKDSLSLRAFLDALPEIPQSQPGPWPGQQEAIDAAFCSSTSSSYTTLKLTNPFDWEQQSPARLAIAQAYDAARPQAAEIAALKAALAESEKQFQDKVYEIARLLDECDKAQRILKDCLAVMPFGNLETHTFENLPGRIADLASEIASLSLENERLEAELAALRQSTQSAQPLLADDGRSLDQVYQDTYNYHLAGNGLDGCCDAGVQAVAAVVLAQAVRTRLLAAAKGEGQPVGVNEPPQSEGQPDLSGESEKQDEPAQAQQEPAQPWTPDNAKAYEDFQAELRETWAAQPWTPAVGDTVRLKSGGPAMTVTGVDPLSLMCAWMNADNDLQVEPITTLCLTPVPAP